MGVGASFLLKSSRPPPHGHGGLLRFGITKVPVTWAWGPPLCGNHRGPRRMGAGASFALGPFTPQPHVCGGLLCFGTTKAPAPWA